MTPEEEANWLSSLSGAPLPEPALLAGVSPAAEGESAALLSPSASHSPICPHWWQLESPNGELCKGTCKRCGTTRTWYTAGPPDLNRARAYAAPHYEPPTMARFM